jgi:ubiquinone/menaquinone biosynthesis C-methylase UbiE
MSLLLASAGIAAGVLVLTRMFMAPLYDVLIVKMTAQWYAAVLRRLPAGAKLLDIGIGTATALVRNADVVRSKQLEIVGVDYEASYVRRATAMIAGVSLDDRIKVHCCSIYDDLSDMLPAGQLFDAGYFSGSLTLMPDPPGALRAASRLVVPNGPLYITQTFQNVRSPIMERVKPLLRVLTTVDFGVVTYHSQVAEIVAAAGLSIVEDKPVEGSIDTYFQTARVIEVRAR